MNKLKRILLREATVFIPFAFAFNKLNRSWDEKGDGKLSGKFTQNRLLIFNSVINASITFAFFLYPLISIDQGTFNYKKWGEIGRQREIEREKQQKIYYLEEFNKADVDKNYVLDSMEFYNYFNKQKN
ncbi:MAG: hypothetical protein NTZ83_04210 [Candidatus Pacearchaeota archaeon]|nr:hypothetical protein [Candidatus Pacearchaeota archaeon]